MSSVNMTEYIHGYKQYLAGMGLYQFIWDHIFLSWPQPSVPPVLTATSFPVCDHTEDFWLFSMFYQSSRCCMWGYTQAHLPELSGQLLLWTLPHCSAPGAISWHATSRDNQVRSMALPQPNNFYEVCSLLPSDLVHVTHPPPPPCTWPPISWLLENAMFLPALRPLHRPFPLRQMFSLTLPISFIS